ncbi:hypothetical protein SAMN05444008_11555 [Cnuella takakiae]|uniref:Uncharacterized protein n=1 Tax=Cnuella takakiae TaxID=1302690 RepID=A0A1M5G0V7_9BACT|nr:hypothetical protein [Cnuella takakiae]OLY92289.1 hypothetical protein BUE76_10585 [Cnuella takakiae]SHF97395.1 hypothetical protein SAMN05444008_11555 [Cnuella takakiae]
MGFFKDRSDYFKSLANKHKLVAHKRIEGKHEKNSFHRMNDEEELLAACVNWAHFPCVVHAGMSGRYTEGKQSLVKRKTTNQLMFLSKVDHPTNMDSREACYDLTMEIMEDFIAFMLGEFHEKGFCSNFSNIDLNRFSFSTVSFNGNLFGWQLTIEDDAFPDITNSDTSKWFD